MHNYLGWDQIALRLFLTVVGASLIGTNRAEHGRAARICAQQFWSAWLPASA